jgi:signal transduction histidine kinase
LAQLKERIAAFETAADAIEVPLRKTLALSRVNRDVAARDTMLQLDEHFSAIESSIAELVAMNRNQSVSILQRVETLHRTAVHRVRNLAVLGIAVSLTVGVFTARVLGRGQERLRRYSTALEEKNRELDAFAGRVAHDLRGPLNTVGLATSRLERRWPETRETTATMRRAVKRVDLLIDDLLALSRMTTAEANAVSDPATAAAQVREDLVPELQETDVAVRLNVQPANVRCGESLLRQVLWNLVENSVKYRRREVHTEVEIRGRPMDGTYELSVTDNGSGMSPDEASHAFDPLFRGEAARQQPGTGLGLSIVKRVIDASGGTITIDSHPGEGTMFCTFLPLVKGTPDRGRGVKTTPSDPS